MIGAGYVGLVTGACFAEMGNNVMCVDIDEDKIKQLNMGKCPIYEPGIEELIQNNYKQGRLNFTTSSLVGMQNSSIYFIAVGTPMTENGEANLDYVFDIAKKIGQKIILSRN